MLRKTCIIILLLFLVIATKYNYGLQVVEGYENSTMSSEPPPPPSSSTTSQPPPPPSNYGYGSDPTKPKPFELKTMQVPLICPVCPSTVIISKGEIEQQKLNNAIQSNASQGKIASSFLASNSNLQSQVGEYVSGNGGLSDSSSGYIVRPYIDVMRSFV